MSELRRMPIRAAGQARTRWRRAVRRLRYGDKHGQHWVRVVMDREIESRLRALTPERAEAIEISGDGRSHLPWRSYRSVHYPEYDLLAPHPLGQFDVVICEQVLEHVDDPRAAIETLVSLCRAGGVVVVSTPFMLRIHGAPEDHWRFTPSGLRRLLECAGVEIDQIGAWGNQSCIRANRREWAAYRWWHRVSAAWALRNDTESPQVVWAIARLPA